MKRSEPNSAHRLVVVLWPSFLVAGVAAVLVFVLFDPIKLLANTRHSDSSRIGAYSLGFFGLWLITATSSWLTCYFQRSPRNTRPSASHNR